MSTRRAARFSARALIAALFGVGCAVGEPLVDTVRIVASEEGSKTPLCLMPSSLCSTPDITTGGALAPRALSLSACSPLGGTIGFGEDSATAECAPPPPGADWRNASVVLRADEPREIVVSGISVAHTHVRLEGPITLILRELSLLADTSLSTTSPEAELVIDGVDGERVTVGDPSTPFAGHVEVRQARLDFLSMVGASLHLDSAMIAHGFVSVDALNSGDGLFRDVLLELGDALFAPSRLERTQIARCETLSFFGGYLESVVIPRCEGEQATRIYDLTAKESVLDGVIHGEGGKLERVQLGRYHPSEYVLWGVSVVGGSMFCDHALRVESTNHIRCSHCTEGAFGPTHDEVCNLEPPDEERTDVKRNLCEPLDLQTECRDPKPARVRPISDYWL